MSTQLDQFLAVSIATQKIGCAFFSCGEPFDWRVSKTASTSTHTARDFVTDWIYYYHPEALVLEAITDTSRQGTFSRDISTAIERAARDQQLPVIPVEHMQRYPNKYAEAQALAERFPELAPFVPKPRQPWESEPRNIAIFRAVALGLEAHTHVAF